jgi:hypothetical protein
MPTLFIENLVMIVIEFQKRQGSLKLEEAVCDEYFEVYVSFSQPLRRLLIWRVQKSVVCTTYYSNFGGVHRSECFPR